MPHITCTKLGKIHPAKPVQLCYAEYALVIEAAPRKLQNRRLSVEPGQQQLLNFESLSDTQDLKRRSVFFEPETADPQNHRTQAPSAMFWPVDAFDGFRPFLPPLQPAARDVLARRPKRACGALC